MAFEEEKTVIERRGIDHPIPVKDWTQLDHITHDYNDCERYREYCLGKYGQYMGINAIRKTLTT